MSGAVGRASAIWIIAIAALASITIVAGSRATAQDPKRDEAAPHKHDDDSEHTPHVHAPVPPEYRAAHLPAAAWTHHGLIARGKEIYATRCAVCHGENGDGKGPAAAGLPLKPASFRDAKMVSEMAGNYWFWRVSEGGVIEPFRSMGSVMPPWKDELSVEDRWAVVAYTHTLSGHEGPHVTSEHPQMLAAEHAEHGAKPGAAGTTPAKPTPTPQGGTGSHKH